MSNLLDGIRNILLMGPGPSCVPEEVYRALAKPTIGHLDPYFIRIMDEIRSSLQRLMGTRNPVTFPVSGTGSAGMETCFVNLLEKGDPVLILINGVFGQRMLDVARRLGAEADSVEFDWGTPVVPSEVSRKLKTRSYKLVAMVHAETSTGVRNPVKEVGEMLQDSDALFVVDAVTSLGGIEVRMDEWRIDALYSATQKCLSVPPGLAPLSFSERAVKVLTDRKSKVPNWYLDVSMIIHYWEGLKRSYHHTAPINMLYALYQGLRLIEEEGTQKVFARHRETHHALVTGLRALSIDLMVEPEYRLPMLNSVYSPAGIDEEVVRKNLLMKHDIEIGAGLGPLAGKIWRIGLMGHTARPEAVSRFLGALSAELQNPPV
jgi:alanine-glyoxylate transaminase/serine-glyoxylate transaminase/serine-pyruvate transaminase